MGDYLVFYPSDGGREGLWIVVMSASVRWFGHTVFAVRFWAPLVGVLTVAALYGLASRWFGRRIGLIAAWLLATSFWHVLFSRVGFRGILVPLFLVSAIYFLQAAWYARGARAITLAVLGGCCVGLGFYSYIPFRLSPVLAASVLGLELTTSDHARRRKLQVFLVWALVAVIIAAPLGFHFLRQPQDFSSRMTQVSALASPHPAKLIWKNTVRSVWMFVGKGDLNWRQNVRGMPELGYPMALFFVIGLTQVFRGELDRQGRERLIVVLFWLALMLVPAILSSEGVPHALRSIGALPPAILIAAVGAEWMWRRAEQWRITHERRYLTVAVVIVVIVASGISELYRYFGVWARREQVQQAYQAPQLQASKALRSLPPSKLALVAVEEPTDYDWKSHASVYANPDGSTALLPLQAQIPLFISGDRPRTTYVNFSGLAAIDLHAKYGCAVKEVRSLAALPPNALTFVTGCDQNLVFLRLTSKD
jgi:4-amino-4-deoxy-L-arabinose transferase-like glycosyltransferase